MPRHNVLTLIVFIALLLCPSIYRAQQPQGDPKLTEVWEPVPRVITPGLGTAPPSDAIVLFSGNDLSEWQHGDGSPAKWTIADGAFTLRKGTGDIRTKRAFGDCQLHVEWRAPVKIEGDGQERANSGVFLMGRYEVQILDSYNNPTYSNGQAASIYKQHSPLVNASRPPGEWQSYDIFFRAPRFTENGGVRMPAYITVIHNGVLVQDHVELKGSTVFIGAPSYEKHSPKEPLVLQGHGKFVNYRNIWIRELSAPTPPQQSAAEKKHPLMNCLLARQSDGMFAGNCRQPYGVGIPGTVGPGEVWDLRLAAPVPNEAGLWRGTVRSGSGASPVGVDQAGAFRWMRYWAAVTDVQLNGDTFQFSFDPATTVAPTKDDLEILRRARVYLEAQGHWAHQPEPDVYAAATAFVKDPSLSKRGFCPAIERRTLFCALYLASIEQTGEFWWGRPAVNAIRAAISADDASEKLQHPLMDFNGAPEIKLADVQRVFDVAIAYVKEARNCGVQYWVWGAPVSKRCQ
jgi:hypothetical protein